ncbi:sigma factor G inhibitor Gin [Phosphitispora sp. TUW77]|uniref:sigma factor G inhibitor Gin n=1 Tax=Phosphitispora sp. TUW77 TaxID=3152361 RepID=UPI003AB4CC02
MKELLYCSFCAKQIYGSQEGLNLLGGYICEECEKEIVNSSVDDKSYFLLKEKMKNIWFS